MENEVKKFDANDAMKSVKERIKDSFVSLIPDEQWNEMVKKEVDSYFRPQEVGYQSRSPCSSFTRDVHTVLETEVKIRVKDYLAQNFQTVWDSNGKPKCDLKIEEFIIQNSGKILADMIGYNIQVALSSAGYKINP